MTSVTSTSAGKPGTADLDMTHRQILEALSGLLLGLFVAILSSTIVSNALPTIVNDLKGSQSGYTWVVTATLLATTASTPIWGKLSDLYSKKLLVQLSLIIFVLSSAVAGLSQSMGMLIAARVVQGLGAGGLTALTQVCLAAMIPPRERGRYSGYLGATLAVATVAGPLIGGVIVDTSWLGWRWCFYVGVPFAVAAIILLQKTLHLPTFRRDNVRIDWLGATLITGSVSLLLIWVSLAGTEFDWWSWQTITMVVGAIVIAAGALYVESKAAEPIIPLKLFKVRSISLAVVASLFVGVGMFGATVFLSQYFQISRGDTPTQAGLSTMPLILGLFVSSLISGQIITRTGKWKRFLVGGGVLITLGFAAMSTLRMDTPYWLLACYMAVIGIGLGMTMQNLVLSVQNAVPITELGVASSTVAFFRSLGGAVGVAALGAVLGEQVTSHIASGLAAIGIPAGATGGSSQIPDLKTLPAPIALIVQQSYGIAAGDIFLVATPITLLALIAVLFIKEVPLRTTNKLPDQLRDEAESASLAEGIAFIPVESAERSSPDAAESGAIPPAQNGRTPTASQLAATNGHAGTAGAGRDRVLSNATQLSGSVRGPDQQGVAGAAIAVLDDAGAEVVRGSSADDGHYQLTLPSGGTFLVVVSTVDHRPAVATVRVADGRVERDFSLDAASALGGSVRDAGGEPRSGVTVTVIDARGDVVGVAVTGPTGRYELADLQPGDYTLTAIAAGANPAAYGVHLDGLGQTDFDIELPENGSLHGTVRNRATGTPVAQAAVAILDHSGMTVGETTSDDSGVFVFDALTPGDYTVVASGFGPTARQVRVEPNPGQSLDIDLGHDADGASDGLATGRHSRVERNSVSTWT
ncbi:MAG: MFS transporter [Nakamurella sp.]